MSGNNWEVESTQGSQGPSSELDIYDGAMSSQVEDETIGAANLGLGYYDESEYWMQQRAFHDAMFAGAVGSTIEGLAEYEAKVRLAIDGGLFTGDDEDPTDVEAFKPWEKLRESDKPDVDLWGTDAESARAAILRLAEERWSDLSDGARRNVLEEFAGGASWDSPHKRMLLMRHEASRSKGARLLDNTYGRVNVTEYRGNMDDEERSKLLSFGDK